MMFTWASAQHESYPMSDAGAVSGQLRLHLAPRLLGVAPGATAPAQLAPEDLRIGLPEVLRQEGVDDGVHRGVAVGEAVGCHAQHEGRLV